MEQADAHVSEIMKRLTDVFGEERATLEKDWGRRERVDRGSPDRAEATFSYAVAPFGRRNDSGSSASISSSEYPLRPSPVSAALAMS